jgi:hypothetical protein
MRSTSSSRKGETHGGRPTGFSPKVYYSRQRNESRREYLKLHAAVRVLYKAVPSMEVTAGTQRK